MEVVWSDLALESVTEILAYVDGFFGQRTAQRVARDMFGFIRL